MDDMTGMQKLIYYATLGMAMETNTPEKLLKVYIPTPEDAEAMVTAISEGACLALVCHGRTVMSVVTPDVKLVPH